MSLSLDQALANPFPSQEYLRSTLVGKCLKDDIPYPSAIIDQAKVKHNCKLMLDAIKRLGVSFRAHVKTHKCTELTRLQVGEDCKDVRLIVSTIVEAEQLVPLLLEYKSKGAEINVLYGVPLGPAQIKRVSRLGSQLGAGSITVMIDCPEQLTSLKSFKISTGFPISIYLKTDTGYHRAGVDPSTTAMSCLVSEVIALENAGEVKLSGFYSHAGHSYGGSSPSDAMTMLKQEISVCHEAIKQSNFSSRTSRQPISISVGASPTALSIQNLTAQHPPSTVSTTLQDLITTFTTPSSTIALELHAGVYPLLDMQQLAASSRHLPTISNSIALTVLTSVHSLYPRPQRPHPQALTAAGSLALGREPCKSYPGWGVVSNWNLQPGYDEMDASSRMIVSLVSQEHGLVSNEHTPEEAATSLPLTYGQQIRIYPNHACITCAMYCYYLIVDSSSDKPDSIIDVWVRWRGW